MSNYVVPLDAAPSGITRPLVEILRDLNKRVPETIVLPASRRASASDPVIPWYHANRMLSFYTPGWCGEVHDVIYNENGKVTVVYRVTIRGIDGENNFYVRILKRHNYVGLTLARWNPSRIVFELLILAAVLRLLVQAPFGNGGVDRVFFGPEDASCRRSYSSVSQSRGGGGG
ncbi:snrk1-interacting protein 1 [Hordeum vulgare]|nr:snrk1-interacting protein 1 [Hordeum vulgare]